MRNLVLAPLLLAASPALANGFTDPSAIDAEVSRFAGPGAQPVDRRLKLAACANPLSLEWYAGRRDTVLVRCPDAGGWRLFVAIAGTPTAAAPAVLKGEAVTVAVKGPGFTVSQSGEAMEPGAVGAWIRIRTAAGGTQPLRAQVVRPGLVSVDLGADLP